MGEQGRVAGIAIKRVKREPLVDADEARVTEDGIEGNIPQEARRRVTLIGKEQWEEVQNELDSPELSWKTRRANILIEGVKPGNLIGKSVRIGEVELAINGQTHGCELMDALKPGLRAALKPDCRAGVYGSVTTPGTIRVGDTVAVVAWSKGRRIGARLRGWAERARLEVRRTRKRVPGGF